MFRYDIDNETIFTDLANNSSRVFSLMDGLI